MRYYANCISLRQTIPIPCKLCIKKLPMITFTSYFLILITYCQYTVMISDALLTNDILISFGDPMCSLKHTTFLIISPHNVSKSFPFRLAFGLVISLSSRYLSPNLSLIALETMRLLVQITCQWLMLGNRLFTR